MNITFFYESLDLGGQQTYTYEIMKCLEAKGHKLDYIYCQEAQTLKERFEEISTVSYLSPGLEDREYRTAPWKLFFVVINLFFKINKRNTDVIISGSGIGSLICGLAAKLSGKKHFRLVGCSLKQVEPTLFKYYTALKIDRLIDCYFGFNAVFDELREKKVSDEKFIFLPLAVNHKQFYPLEKLENSKLREELGIKEKELVIGWIGRICKTMQVWNTAELGKRLLEKGFFNFRLLFVGGGPDLDEFHRYLEKLKLTEKSICTDWVSYEEVNRYLNVMDVVPLLSEDPQGGSIIREAMSASKVTISVDGPSGVQREFMLKDFSFLVSTEDFIEDSSKIIIDYSNSPETFQGMGNLARQNILENMNFNILANIIEQRCKV